VRFVVASWLALCVAVVGAASAHASSGPGAPPPQLAANLGGWPAHNYDLANTRDDTDTAIDAANVAKLHQAWTFPLRDSGAYGRYTTNALVLDGRVFFESPDSNVYALSAATGKLLWEHRYDSLVPSGGPTGLAAGYGLLYGATASSAFALRASDGRQIWRRRLTRNPREGIDMAPAVYDHRVLISTIPGSAKGFYEPGAYGVVFSLDARTGKVRWRFSTVKGGASLWGDPQANGGGGLWYPPAVDASGRIFIGTGNPSPVYGTPADPNARSRPGRNLYTDSLVALAPSGKLLWYRQLTPHDVRDFDFQDSPILARIPLAGKRSEIVIGAGKSGKVEAFRAADGHPLWLDEVGRHNRYQYGPLPRKPVLMCPGSLGGVTTPIAYSHGLVFVPWVDLCMTISATRGAVPRSHGSGGVEAIDAASGRVVWRHHFAGLPFGAATVANDVVFVTTYQGYIYALSTRTGRVLWHVQSPGAINGFPAITRRMLIVGTGAPYPPRANAKTVLVAYKLP
jgi:outer membrane protein assembly factor BamB